MSRGYVVQATTTLELQQAELLANSLISKNKNYRISLVTNLKVEDADCFESVIEYPFGVKSITRSNDWQLFWATPYEYTIVLDCKMIVLESHDTMWEYLIDHHSVCLPTEVLDFRNNILKDIKFAPHRDEYKFRKVYANMFYFDKSEESMRYFKLLDPFMQNWQTTCNSFLLKAHVPLEYDNNMMHTIVANTIDVDVFALHSSILSHIDMHTTHLDNLLPPCNQWTDILSVWPSESNKIKLQNFSMTRSLYYHEDTFYTEQIADDFRNHRNTVTK